MRIFVNNIETGAEYDGIIYDYWIDCSLKNGQQIRVFDNKPFDLRSKNKQYVECLIECGFISIPGDQTEREIVQGTLIGEFELPNHYGINHDEFSRTWCGFKTENGIFLITRNEIMEIGCQSTAELKVGRFDLIGYEQDDL